MYFNCCKDVINVSTYFGSDQSNTDLRAQENSKSVQKCNSRNDRHNDQPEPDKDKDLLIDDVQRQNAKSILVLYSSRWTILVEGTLGDLRVKNLKVFTSIYQIGPNI